MAVGKASRHGQGVGTQLLRAVLEQFAGGVERVIVGTGNAGIGQLAYYQKAGFRSWRIERRLLHPGAAATPRASKRTASLFANMVWMDQRLGGPPRPDRSSAP